MARFITIQRSLMHSLANHKKIEVSKLFAPSDWSVAVEDIEKKIGFLTPKVNLASMLTDEFKKDGFNLDFIKMIKSSHLDNIVQHNLNGRFEDIKPWSLFILLLSKSVKLSTETDNDKSIEENQKKLAEIIEICNIYYYLHTEIEYIQYGKASNDKHSVEFSKKIAALLRAYSFSTIKKKLAELRNNDVMFLVSSGLAELAEGIFFGERDGKNKPLPGLPKKTKDNVHIKFNTKSIDIDNVTGSRVKEWTTRSLYNGVSLLGKGCQSAMILGNQNEEIVNHAYDFGCQVGLAWQASAEIKALFSDDTDHFCLASAPVLFALESNPDLFKLIAQMKHDVGDMNYEDLRLNILNTDAIEKTKMLYKNHAKKAIMCIERFGQNECVDYVNKLINAF